MFGRSFQLGLKISPSSHLSPRLTSFPRPPLTTTFDTPHTHSFLSTTLPELMPLDAANHLAAQGWAGAGKPLRAGPNALSRPIVGVQKKTLGGVGKDRDDAFAFWDQ